MAFDQVVLQCLCTFTGFEDHNNDATQCELRLLINLDSQHEATLRYLPSVGVDAEAKLKDRSICRLKSGGQMLAHNNGANIVHVVLLKQTTIADTT